MSSPIRAEIRSAGAGFILNLPWPYGPEVSGLGEVVCRTWEEAMQELRKPFDHIIEEEEPVSDSDRSSE